MLAADVPGNGLHRPRAVQRYGGDDVFKALGLHVGEERAHAAAFQLEYAVGIPAGNHLADLRVLQRYVIGGKVYALLGQQVQRIADDRQRAQPQKVHLQQAQALHHAHGVLGGDDVIVSLQRHIVSYRVAGDKDARGMGARVAGHALQQQASVNQALHPRVAFIAIAQFAVYLQRALQRDVQFARNHLGDDVRLLVAVAQHPAYVPKHTAGGHGAKGNDLADMVVAVTAGHIVDDLLAALKAKVHVNVRHGDTLRV